MYVAAQWYSRRPRAGAIYVQSWSFHWAIRHHKYEDGVGFTRLPGRPRRTIVFYRGLYDVFTLKLWPLWSHCEHGFYRRSAWWHRCDLVSAANPKGRPADDELWDEDPTPISSFRGRR